MLSIPLNTSLDSFILSFTWPVIPQHTLLDDAEGPGRFLHFRALPNLRLAGPGIHGRTGLARSNTGFDTCVQYALPDQGPEEAGS